MDIAGPTRVLGENPLGIQPAYAQNDAEPETIEVISQQWDWSFRYPNQNVVSDELHLPSDRRVRLILQSKDVLHGFYVPEFRIKQDIIPNRSIDFQLSSFLLPGGTAQAGWWSYPPLSIQNPTGNLLNGQLFWCLSLVVLGISSIMAALNFVTTIVWLRSPLIIICATVFGKRGKRPIRRNANDCSRWL